MGRSLSCQIPFRSSAATISLRRFPRELSQVPRVKVFRRSEITGLTYPNIEHDLAWTSLLTTSDLISRV
jgi:hypothetical protein